MPQVQINLRETIDVPDGAQIVLAKTGQTTGIRLPNGDLLKPWIKFEHFKDPNSDAEGDLYEHELNDLGVFTDIEFDREIEAVEGDVEVDHSAVAAD